MRALVQNWLGGWIGDGTALADWLTLTKARLTGLAVATAGLGFYLGSPGAINPWRFFHVLCGTWLLAGGAAALNQVLERDLDARMKRTCDRPLPAGRMESTTATLFGVLSAGAGLFYLAWLANPLTGLLGAVTLVTYLAIYTPLKRCTPLNTLVGAVPGAMPPLMGWAAASGSLTPAAWALFAIQFFWQIPHFLAIAWLYAEDYARAGFRMLPSVDATGKQTGWFAISHTFGLVLVSLAPFLLGLAGLTYLVLAVLLGAVFLWLALAFARALSQRTARLVFLASIVYLPLLLTVMVCNKLH